MIEIEKKASTRSASKANCVSKTTIYKTKAGKCQRPSPNGVLHRNPYLNFLREFRLRNGHLPAVEIIRRGAKEWKNMPKEDKAQFIEEAFYAPKKKRRSPMVPVHKAPMNLVPYLGKCGVCPKVNPCAKKRRRKSRKSRCGRKRRPKKKRCAKKRKPKCRR
ncbi:uncharacterized protein LOC129241599 [Anastrepha obliqua]|uniref:uncharacterized protein LOC129241599 n=1 Tax=Anastrepha obliqua TaxID=95512 RepID=UPI00240A56FA|nr:uncharacterized protein LOC129241599 [Anastrepha obliqua]